MFRYLNCFIAMSLLCISTGLSAHKERVQSEDQRLIREFPPIQNTAMLLASIPPELQNLSYAVYPNDPKYNTDRLNFNKRFVYFPKAIFIPETNHQIKFVIKALKKHHLPFAVRSGGHCFEPGSLSSDYIVDLRKFNSIIPDIANQQVFIGAGCQLGTVIETLGQIDYAIPTGTCPTVAVGGLALGGGIGFLCRDFGLTCDSVISITFLNADAEIIQVDAESHPDLFWALRGGGNGSYGIALGFTFKMYHIPVATFYELIWEWDQKLVVPLMTAWQKWVETLPDNITTVLGLRHPNIITAEPENTPDVVIRIHGIKVGPEPFTEWVSAFEKFNPQVKLFQGSYLFTAQFWANESPFPFNKNKSRIMEKPVSKKVMKLVAKFFEKVEEENPDSQIYFNFEAFGGKFSDFSTAFFPRKAFGWWQQAYFWEFQEESAPLLALSQAFDQSIPREVSRYRYANMVDYDLGRKYLKDYYGTHVDRLIKIKRKYDPKNLFHWKQSIPLHKSDVRQIPLGLEEP